MIKNIIHKLLNLIKVKPHPLSDEQLQKRILKELKNASCYSDYDKAKEFINNNQLDKFEEICRYYHYHLKSVGYQLTPGRVCIYWENGNVCIECYINSKNLRHGDYKIFNGDGELIFHKLFVNDDLIKDYLED